MEQDSYRNLDSFDLSQTLPGTIGARGCGCKIFRHPPRDPAIPTPTSTPSEQPMQQSCVGKQTSYPIRELSDSMPLSPSARESRIPTCKVFRHVQRCLACWPRPATRGRVRSPGATRGFAVSRHCKRIHDPTGEALSAAIAAQEVINASIRPDRGEGRSDPLGRCQRA